MNATQHQFFGQPNRPRIVCLCGSTRFQEFFESENARFTRAGYVVLSVGCFIRDKERLIGVDEAEQLDALHLQKINLADTVHIINWNGYVGESTAREIVYAVSIAKPITFFVHELSSESTQKVFDANRNLAAKTSR